MLAGHPFSLRRALSEAKPKAKAGLSASHTCALNESERERSTNLVQQVVQSTKQVGDVA